MPNRIVREGIIDSPRINALPSWGAEVFYRRLMSVVDDFGRFEAHPQILLSKCYPLKLESVSTQDINGWLEQCEQAALLRRYNVASKAFLQIDNFGQRARTAKYPGPSESDKPHSTKAPPPPKSPPVAEQEQMFPVAVPTIDGKPLFERVVGAFLAAGVKLNEKDMLNAGRVWVSLPESEYEKAALCAEETARTREAEFMPSLPRFLRNTPWTRNGPGRLLPPPKAPPKSNPPRATATELLRKRGIVIE